jgi:hypothetical protein
VRGLVIPARHHDLMTEDLMRGSVTR